MSNNETRNQYKYNCADIVILKPDLENKNKKIGVILEVYVLKNKIEYLVEFCNDLGETLDTPVINEEDLELIKKSGCDSDSSAVYYFPDK